jgi:hypothetical protein
MRFVDHHQTHPMSGTRPQYLHECRLRQPLRRDKNDAALSIQNALQRLPFFAAAQRAVHQSTVDARRQQFVGLVLHHGDERRYDERRAIEM